MGEKIFEEHKEDTGLQYSPYDIAHKGLQVMEALSAVACMQRIALDHHEDLTTASADTIKSAHILTLASKPVVMAILDGIQAINALCRATALEMGKIQEGMLVPDDLVDTAKRARDLTDEFFVMTTGGDGEHGAAAPSIN